MSLDPIASLEGLSLSEFVRFASAEPLEDELEIVFGGDLCAEDAEARQRLVRAHLRDVVDEAIAHRGSGVSIDALVRRGLRGLAMAARRYDPERDAPFSEFARQAIRRALRDELFAH